MTVCCMHIYSQSEHIGQWATLHHFSDVCRGAQKKRVNFFLFDFVCHVYCVSWWKLDLFKVKIDVCVRYITEFLRTAYQPFAYCVQCNPPPLNTAYQKGGVSLSEKFRVILTLYFICCCLWKLDLYITTEYNWILRTKRGGHPHVVKCISYIKVIIWHSLLISNIIIHVD